ncbi:MAG: hypothetical protein GXO80_09910 [Chlorobi bacterium]|nr:hypothetical protein [Chlorobiota bacterium]
MIQFEKYLSRDMNVINSTFFELKLKMNPTLKSKFETYKNDSFKIKNMFLIREAEKEIKHNKKLKSFGIQTDMFLKANTSDTEIFKFLQTAF